MELDSECEWTQILITVYIYFSGIKELGARPPKDKVKRAENGALCYTFSTLYYINVPRIL